MLSLKQRATIRKTLFTGYIGVFGSKVPRIGKGAVILVLVVVETYPKIANSKEVSRLE